MYNDIVGKQETIWCLRKTEKILKKIKANIGVFTTAVITRSFIKIVRNDKVNFWAISTNKMKIKCALFEEILGKSDRNSREDVCGKFKQLGNIIKHGIPTSFLN